MYKRNFKIRKTTVKVNDSYQGETIEEKLRRILNNKEGLTDGAPLVFTERKDGVLPGYDIRTDRFEIAVEAKDKIHKSEAAKREAKVVDMDKKKTDEKKTENKKDGGPEPTQATEKQ